VTILKNYYWTLIEGKLNLKSKLNFQISHYLRHHTLLMKKIIISFIILIQLNCHSSKILDLPLQFEELTTTGYKLLDTIVNNKDTLFSGELYITVFPYENNSRIEEKIDSFVCNNKPFNISKYNTFYLYFYRKTKQTNNGQIAKNIREFDRYSMRHDLLYTYTWAVGKVFFKSIHNLEEHEQERRDTFNCPNLW
jgi:hypothetical protein